MLSDMLTGQISVRRDVFLSVGGFDTGFTIGGTFGNEDLDFCYRLKKLGYRIVYNPDAISWQKYIVTPRQYLSQRHQAGGADVAFVRKHADEMDTFFPSREPFTRWIWRALSSLPWSDALTSSVLDRIAIRQIEHGGESPGTRLIFSGAANLKYWRGVHEAGGIPRPRPVRVLAYHAIADLKGQGPLEPYGVPVDEFRQQIDSLENTGYCFIGVDEFLRYLRYQGGVPRPLSCLRSMTVTKIF